MTRWPLIAVWMSLASSACHSGTDGDLPREYRAIVVPAGVTSPAALERGAPLFQKYCTLCHGVRGDGDGLQREGLQPPPRDFRDPGWRAAATPRHVFFAIREGRRGTAMPGWKSLSEQDAWDLTGYVLSLAGQK